MSGGGFFSRGGGWVLAQLVLFLMILLAPRLVMIAIPYWLRWLSAPLIVLAAYLGTGGLYALGGSLSIFPKPLSDAALVRSGPYRLVRHPIYGALILGTLGWALWRQHLPGLMLVLALAVFFDRKSRHEEGMLKCRYPDYADFCKKTRRRLIPFLY